MKANHLRLLTALTCFSLAIPCLASCSENPISAISVEESASEVMAEEAKFDEFALTYYSEKGGYYVGDYKGSLTALKIPEEATGDDGVTRPVVGVAGFAFFGRDNLEAVVLGENIKYIDANAFSSSKVKDVRVTTSLKSVHKDAFADSLIELPEKDGFKYLSSQTERYAVMLYESGITYDFSGDSPVSFIHEKCHKAIVMDGVSKIPEYAFMVDDFKSYELPLKAIEVPDSVLSIGKGAFGGRNYLTEPLKIPFFDKTINDYFEYQGKTKEGTIWASKYAAEGVTTPIVVGDKTAELPANAFARCNKIQSIQLPSTLVSIGDNAFSGCWVLPSLHIPDSVTKIGRYAFNVCHALTTLDLPPNLTDLGYGAFDGCDGLYSLTIPSSLQTVDSGAIPSSLKVRISVAEGNPTYDSREDCKAIIRTEDNVLIYGNEHSKIPESVTAIGNYAFRDCKGLDKLQLPANLTSIGNGAFRECANLASVGFPSTLTSIGNGAFSGCARLEKITIPGSVKTLGENAFSQCTGAYKITLNEGTKSIGLGAFWGDSSLTSIIIPASVTEIAEWAFDQCTSLKTIYCRAKSKPRGWAKRWNYFSYTGSKTQESEFKNVVWGYTG